MTAWTFRAIDTWPWPFTNPREYARFRAPWSRTRELLERELRQLDADRAVLGLAYRGAQLRVDGTGPRADARPPEHPGVILVADTKHGALRYATDRFTTWQDNVRAIALALEALRAVERYGITRSGEQYRGFAALPAAGIGSRDDDIALLAAWSQWPADEVRLDPAGAFREAARRTHPDVAGGNATVYSALVSARDRLVGARKALAAAGG